MTTNQKEKNRLRAAKRYRERVAAKLCVYCDAPAEQPHIRCELHREIVSDYSAGVRDIRKLKNLCAECGKRPPRKDRVSCAECAARQNINRKKHNTNKYAATD